ncbi:MAG: anthrone oxygenase family protein [Actinomycetota bacterium]
MSQAITATSRVNQPNAPGPLASIPPGLAVIGSAAYTGVLITIGLGLGRYWQTVPPQDYAAQFDEIFEFLLPAIAITLLPAMAGIALSLRRAWNTTAKTLWLAAAIALAASLAITVLYHVPANNRIWSDTITADDLDTERARWLGWHAARTIAGLTAALATFAATTRHDATDPS